MRQLPSCARLGPFGFAQGRLARRPSPHNHMSCARLSATLRGRARAPVPPLTKLVQRRLAWWAGLPAAVHPEPLVGVAADDVFDDFGEFCGVGDNVGLVISCANQLYGGIKGRGGFAEFCVSQGKSGGG